MKTKAEPQPDGTYKIYGTKIYITYGDHDMAENIIHLVLARTPDAPEGTKGISLFLVRSFVNDDGSLGDRNDVKCIGLEDKLGIHASPTCVMSFGENDGAVGWLIGAENTGMAAMFTMMNNARLNVGIQEVGLAEQATQIAMSYAADRLQGRAPDAERGDNTPVPIATHPDVRNMLMTMRSLTDARALYVMKTGYFMILPISGEMRKRKLLMIFLRLYLKHLARILPMKFLVWASKYMAAWALLKKQALLNFPEMQRFCLFMKAPTVFRP